MFKCWFQQRETSLFRNFRRNSVLLNGWDQQTFFTHLNEFEYSRQKKLICEYLHIQMCRLACYRNHSLIAIKIQRCLYHFSYKKLTKYFLFFFAFSLPESFAFSAIYLFVWTSDIGYIWFKWLNVLEMTID